LIQCFSTWFLPCYSVSPYFFLSICFLNYLYRIYFFHTKLVENLDLQFFSLKHCWLLQCFPKLFFLLWYFSKLSLSILLFLILSWLKITTVDFLMKHYRLLQFFPAWFFLLLFFCDIFQNFLCWFYFVNIELVENYNCIFPHKTL